MPYYFDHQEYLRPKSRAAFFDYIWTVIDNDITGMKIQSEQDAIDKKTKRFLEDDDRSLESLFSIPYRNSDDHENLKLFYDLAVKALEITREKIDAKQFDDEFFQAWTLLAACHGFVCNSLMSVQDDMQGIRAAVRSAESNNRRAQLKWYLHWRRWQVDEKNDSVVRFHRDFLDVAFGIYEGKVAPPPEFPKEWLFRALGEEDITKRKKTESNIKDKKIVKVLPDNFKRSNKNGVSPELLASASNEEPKIPPIGRQNYDFF